MRSNPQRHEWLKTTREAGYGEGALGDDVPAPQKKIN